MNLTEHLKEDNLLIVPHNVKDKVIKTIRNNKLLFNIKFMSLEELKRKYYFDYNDETVCFLIKKYNFKYEIARSYLENIYFIDDKIFESEKLNFLKEMKKDLVNNDLLIYDECFKKYLVNRNIIIYGYDYINKFYTKMLNDIKKNNIISVVNKETTPNQNIKLYSLSTIEDEINFICHEIIDLITKQVDINKIKLLNVNSEYDFLIKKIFNFYHIPIEIDNNYNLYSTKIGKFVIDNAALPIDELVEKIKTNFTIEGINLDIYQKIINIFNSLVFLEEKNIYKEILTYKLKNTFISTPSLKNKIECLELRDNLFDEENYYFLLSFNQKNIPIVYKDEDYFTDNNKSEIDIETTIELNKLEKVIIVSAIKSIKNIVITYKKETINNTYEISSLNDILQLPINTGESKYEHSNLDNKINLSLMLERLTKYGVKDKNINLLYGEYKYLPYNIYTNKYSNIDQLKLLNYINNEIKLSYTSLDNYYKCPFKYYLSNVLRLESKEDNFSLIIGNIFHKVLSLAFEPDFNFNTCYGTTVIEFLPNPNSKEQFFLDKLKNELLFAINTIKKQLVYSLLDNTLYEEKIMINKDRNVKVSFTGVIDKIMYKKLDDKVISIIIDYKTGNFNTDLNNLVYGLNMQLPIYVYLLKNSNLIKNVEVGGFYFQKVISEPLINVGKKYEDQKESNMKLQGYSNDDINILKFVDSNYAESKMIKGLKQATKSFSTYSKIISNYQMNKIVEIVDKNIEYASKNIELANFFIEPKRIDDENVSCKFCKYKDICFVEEKDIIDLEKKDLWYELGGEQDV